MTNFTEEFWDIFTAKEIFYVKSGGVPANDSSVVLNLKPAVNIYGGFAGMEYSLASRDITATPTILDGSGKVQVIYQE